MGKVWQSLLLVLLGVWATSQALSSGPAPALAQLDPFFYSKTCPNLFKIVGKEVYAAVQSEPRAAASLLRMHFHDCFVKGCDASILLDGDANNPTEKDSLPNLNSVRRYDIIDTIKASVEKSCPNTVSCADILTLASFFSVVVTGGPIWWVPLGRRDSFTPNASLSLANLPGPTFNITLLKQRFANVGLSVTDLVSLSGGHTIGLARCVTITPRLYNYLGTPGATDPTINPSLLSSLQRSCPSTNDSNAGNVTNKLDIRTVTVFDNLYFKNLLQGNGVLQTDQEIQTAASDTRALVNLYAKNQTKFFEDFAQSMINMGNISPLTGKQGEIRKNCRVRNSASSESLSDVETVHSEERDIQSENTMKNILDGVQQVHEGAEKVLEGAAEFFKVVVHKVMKEIEEEELRKIIGDPVLDGVHSSM